MSKPVKPRLPALIATLFERAGSSKKPCQTRLKNGLHIKTAYQENGARALLMWRDSSTAPADGEVVILVRDGQFGEHTISKGVSSIGPWAMILEVPALLSAPISRLSGLRTVSSDGVEWKGLGS